MSARYELVDGRWVKVASGGQGTYQIRPRLRVKVTRLLRALAKWARGGFGLVERRARALRRRACEACPFWAKRGNLGLGECRHPACGCTRVKRWLATERCPVGKWPA